jgi:hypothetical protein
MGGPHDLVVAPAIAVEDIASATAFTEGHPTIVRLLPSGEKLAKFQERIGRRAVDPGGDRRIHGLKISMGAGAAEVTISLSWRDLCPLTMLLGTPPHTLWGGGICTK